MGEGVLKLVDWRPTDKTQAHARQAGMGPLLKKDVWYNGGVSHRFVALRIVQDDKT